ncbi:hypothetical protein M758_2G121300 [Ceratodon purpureus]|nr:hypothetical protein M758_2G121300 [Ceratodon purpureus]
MVWKRKSVVANGEPPKKRGRPRKNANVVDVKEEDSDVVEVKGEGTAAVPLEIKEEDDVANVADVVDVAAKERVHVESPVSVLSDEGASVASDDAIVTEKMLEEEKRLAEERAQIEAAEAEALLKATPNMDEAHFSKLDQLLNQTKIYSQFLLERMDDIAMAPGDKGAEEQDEKEDAKGSKKKGAGNRKATKATKVKEAKDAMDAHIAKVEATEADEEIILEETKFMTEEERNFKEQQEICPLLTGGKLKGYQLKGIKWMISLWQNGLNGILADQMGLGKTVQTIGLLSHLKSKKIYGPFLIVAPLSTLSNWVNEIKRFVPTMNVLLYHSSGGKSGRDDLRRKHMPTGAPKESFPVIVTSFEVVMNDRRFLAKYKWKYIVVDEGHRLKNFDCKLLRELKQLSAENLLLLTGTPLQNNLPELWSLLNFILPNIFTSLQEFQSWFDIAGRSGASENVLESRKLQVVSKLHHILRPFLLRRLKTDVEKSLPKKKEIILYTPMTEKQKEYNDVLVTKTLNEYFAEKSDNPGAMLKARLNNVCMQLRKNCNHPDLFVSHFDTDDFSFPPADELVAQCAKFKLMDRLLVHLRDRGHKVLIFSQMTKILDLIEYYLEERGHNPCRIDGSVKQDVRQEQIKSFNEDKNRFVFILSTRAGGLGINLTSADTVIIYDSDWNPHADMQAMDRCHRIGQTRPVHVYRLATAKSVECRMLKVATGKLKLEHLVIEKGHFKQEKESTKVVLQVSVTFSPIILKLHLL